MLVCAKIARLDVLRVLQRDDVLARELVVADQIPPVLRLDVQPLHRVPREHVPALLQRNDVRVVGEDLERDRIDILAVLVFRKVERDEVVALQRRAVGGIRVRVLREPGEDVGEVEDGAGRGAHGVREGLQRNGAVVEREPLERRRQARCRCAVCAVCAARIAERVGRRPLGVGDVELVRPFAHVARFEQSQTAGRNVMALFKKLEERCACQAMTRTELAVVTAIISELVVTTS